MKVIAILIADQSSPFLTLTAPIDAQPLVSQTVQEVLAAQCVDKIIIIAPAEATVLFRSTLDAFKREITVLSSSGNRFNSAKLAFESIDTGPDDIILIHDASRAFAPPELFRAVVTNIRQGANAVVPVLAVTDTIKYRSQGKVLTQGPDRAVLRTLQTPQGFTVPAFRELLKTQSLPEIDGLKTIAGDPRARRVRTAFDLTVTTALNSTAAAVRP